MGTVLVLWLTVSFAVAYRLTHRPRPRFEERAPRVAWGTLEDHRIKTRDGEELGAWFLKGDDDLPIVLLLHGNKGSRWNSLTRAEIFASQGWGVLMISLRAHGDSSGDFHDVGLSARRDVVAAVEFLEARRPGRPIVVMGTSLGAATAVFAAEELGQRVKGYILESPYKDLKTAVWNRTDTYLPPALSHAGYLGLRAVGPLFLPNLDEISPLKAIGGIPNDVPVLISRKTGRARQIEASKGTSTSSATQRKETKNRPCCYPKDARSEPGRFLLLLNNVNRYFPCIFAFRSVLTRCKSRFRIPLSPFELVRPRRLW
ncbi:MAG TPA: alpha/beta fold hydrolase [Isosphaeraceae bacterium]|nr:alpha/beta fold hydrolase [Isosphaeraceae bacterium]